MSLASKIQELAVRVANEITSLATQLAGKADSEHTHQTEDVSGLDTSLNAKISAQGSRGSLAGYETLTSTTSAVTITSSSPDDTAVTSAVAVTVSNGESGTTWTKTVGITSGSSTITLGSSWSWLGGEAPTVGANSVLVLKWYGTFGLAALQNTTS